jgi:hypothetical protein
VVDEPAAVPVAEVVEDDPAGGAQAGWHLEQVGPFVGGYAAGQSEYLSGLEIVQKNRASSRQAAKAPFKPETQDSLDDSRRHSER